MKGTIQEGMSLAVYSRGTKFRSPVSPFVSSQACWSRSRGPVDALLPQQLLLHVLTGPASEGIHLLRECAPP